MRTCVICAHPLTGRQSRYCSSLCSSRGFNLARKADGRLAAQRESSKDARAEWRRANKGRYRGRYVEVKACEACGAPFEVRANEPTRTCPDELCRAWARAGAWPSCDLPAQRTWYAGKCRRCGDPFVTDRATARFCTDRCMRRAGMAKRRRVRGEFDIDPRVRAEIYSRDGWVCQICHEPVDGTLHHQDLRAATLDHIEPQSWALIPDHRPTNLRLAHRICNSARQDAPA